jgi:hypothetical protein
MKRIIAALLLAGTVVVVPRDRGTSITTTPDGPATTLNFGNGTAVTIFPNGNRAVTYDFGAGGTVTDGPGSSRSFTIGGDD